MENTKNELIRRIQKNPGFVYRIGTDYYYIGKWICKPCTDEAVTDCHAMYEMCIQAKEQANTALYFQKLRAYSEICPGHSIQSGENPSGPDRSCRSTFRC